MEDWNKPADTGKSTGGQRLPLVDLTQLDDGDTAKVVELRGGRKLTGKLEAIGIIPGATLVKVSSALMKGPIVLEKGAMQFAIGYGMAKKVLVEPLIVQN
jgi:ferrous iron transport protein A